MLYFLVMFSRTKSNVVLLQTLFVSVYLLSKLGTFPSLMSVTSQDLPFRQGVPQLKMAYEDLSIFNKHTISPEDTYSFV
jgi:hypothetical protein